MERLTYKKGNHYYTKDKCIVEIRSISDNDHLEVLFNCLDKLGVYEDAEEQGLLLRPKCRLGDVVYALWSIPTESKYVVYSAEVKEINLSSTNARKMIMYKFEPIAFRGRYIKYYDDDFGEFVFMSQEEAEQALKQMGE